MSMINCPDCTKLMSNSAPACPNCGRPKASIAPAVRPVSILLGIGIFLFPIIFSWFTLRNGHSVLSRIVSFSWLLLLIFITVGDGARTNSNVTTSTPEVRIDAQTEVQTEAKTEVQTEAQTEVESLTGPQNNAIRTAKQYLSMAGFSRNGLIQQLSADEGSGYQVADATIAVDSLNIDWDKEAVRSATQYLSMTGFSCKGLIEQLSADEGSGYTVDQATYGANEAGACQ